jgi:hypothetical protein
MATMLELYETKKGVAANLGGPDATIVDAKKFGTKGTPGVGFSSGDQTPYSAGNNINGGKAADEAGIGAAEGASVVSPGNRYGFQGAAIGGGTTFLPNGWSDAKLYGASNPR